MRAEVAEIQKTLPPGTTLTEDLPLAPDSLYGQVKLRAEEALEAARFAAAEATAAFIEKRLFVEGAHHTAEITRVLAEQGLLGEVEIVATDISSVALERDGIEVCAGPTWSAHRWAA